MDSGHYLAVMHLEAPTEVVVGALGAQTLPAGDYVYIGSALRGLSARLARHRRLDKRHRWHVDALRAAARWVEGRILPGATGRECDLAATVAALPGASSPVPGFGASDCRCPGHLVCFADGAPPLPGELDPAEGIPATVLARDNRFIARVRLADGAEARAYLPNTARLIGVLEPGRAGLLRLNADPSRKTRYTLDRVRVDGAWVALAAGVAEELVDAWLSAGRPLPELGGVTSFEREVRHGRHRLDYRLTLADGRSAWLEVKSLSIADGDDALLSRTPSSRGAKHLTLLGDFAAAGETAAVAFVIQRRARRLLLEDGADPGWLAAVRDARARGVHVLAFESRVTPAGAWLRRPIPVVDRDDA